MQGLVWTEKSIVGAKRVPIPFSMNVRACDVAASVMPVGSVTSVCVELDEVVVAGGSV